MPPPNIINSDRQTEWRKNGVRDFKEKALQEALLGVPLVTSGGGPRSPVGRRPGPGKEDATNPRLHRLSRRDGRCSLLVERALRRGEHVERLGQVA